MKRVLLLIIVTFLLLQLQGYSAGLRAYFSYSTFYSPDHGSYMESYLAVLGKSVKFVKNDNGKFQGTLLITMLFKQKDSIRDFRKYELHSPEVDDTASVNFSFLDQQRIPLPDGTYDMELTISDKNQDRPPFHIEENLVVCYPRNKISVSGIELVESYTRSQTESTLTKSGYDFIPYLDNFFPSSVSKLTYYAEVYNSNLLIPGEEKFAVVTSLNSFETGKLIAEYQGVRRESPRDVNVVFGEFDISRLPSGNYHLIISIRDKNNNEIASNRMFLQRSNPSIRYDLESLSAIDLSNSFARQFSSPDTLREYVRCLFPIASATEKLFIQAYQKDAELEVLQRFFDTFWKERDPVNPSRAWANYFDQVQAVNHDFRCANRKGYDTDRGRVYLQYGAPNHMVKEDKDPAMYPYEIWQYYKAGNQSDRRFVFYSHDITANCYELIHSDVPGEVYNPWWQNVVKRGVVGRDPNNDYVRRLSDDEDGYYGGRSSRNYNDPY